MVVSWLYVAKVAAIYVFLHYIYALNKIVDYIHIYMYPCIYALRICKISFSKAFKILCLCKTLRESELAFYKRCSLSFVKGRNLHRESATHIHFIYKYKFAYTHTRCYMYICE